MPSCVKEEGIGVQDFKGEKDNSQEDGESKCLVKKYSCHALQRQWDTERNLNKTCLSKFPPAQHTNPVVIVIFVVIFGDSSLPEQGPLSKFFQAVKGEVKNLLELFGP